MKIDLTGKNAIVTGSTKGIGFATAKGLAEAGATVVVNGRKQADVDVAVQAIESRTPGARVTGFAGDLASAEGCNALVAAHPDCDILVNNAGIFGPEAVFDTPEMIHYGRTKTANTSVARGLAKRMAGTGVTVNSVLPGPTLSDGVADMLAGQAEKTGKSLDEVGRDFVKAQRPSSIIQRLATVEEVANMIVYTCSE